MAGAPIWSYSTSLKKTKLKNCPSFYQSPNSNSWKPSLLPHTPPNSGAPSKEWLSSRKEYFQTPPNSKTTGLAALSLSTTKASSIVLRWSCSRLYFFWESTQSERSLCRFASISRDLQSALLKSLSMSCCSYCRSDVYFNWSDNKIFNHSKSWYSGSIYIYFYFFLSLLKYLWYSSSSSSSYSSLYISSS